MIKRTKFDKLISDLIREASAWRCEKCGGVFEPIRLQCSHVNTRSIGVTRYDPRNLASLCASCHSYVEGHPLEHSEWFKKVRPLDHHFLIRECNKIKKWKVGEKDQMYDFYKNQMKDLKEKRNNGFTGRYYVKPWLEEYYE